jgi:predicted lipoprotein with Yx(FWY)xxD motif
MFSALATTSGGKTTLAWTLSFGKLSGKAVAAHIHIGKPGAAGPIAVPLCGPCASGARGQVTLTAAQAAAIRAGGAYVNVHTQKNPSGEIRGQVGVSHAVAAALSAVAQGGPAKGVVTGLVVDTAPRPVLAWNLGLAGLSGAATSVRLHVGKPGVPSPTALTLCSPCADAAQGRRALDPNLASAIASGGTYLDVETAASPDGEARGALGHATQGLAAMSTTLGTILVDDRGMTLYMWEKDQGGKSACYDRCATFWPPAMSIGAPVAAGGAKASLLGVTTRTDGTAELTYGGLPLYGFLLDANPGDTKGQGSNGFGAPWWVLAPASGQPLSTQE